MSKAPQPPQPVKKILGLFRKAGFKVEAYPVDWRVGNVFDFSNLAIEGLARTELGMREWIGLVAYHLAGKTDDLLPGPATQ